MEKEGKYRHFFKASIYITLKLKSLVKLEKVRMNIENSFWLFCTIQTFWVQHLYIKCKCMEKSFIIQEIVIFFMLQIKWMYTICKNLDLKSNKPNS